MGKWCGVKVRGSREQTIPANQLQLMQMRRLFIASLVINYSRSPCVCVYPQAFRPRLIKEGEGDKPAREKVCWQIEQQDIYIFHQLCLFLIS